MRFIPALTDVVPYEPGLPIELVKRRYGLDEVVKLASNEFPLPPFPEVKQVVVEALDELQRYPDGHSTDLREALAAHYSVRPRAGHRRQRHLRAAPAAGQHARSRRATRSCSPTRRSRRIATCPTCTRPSAVTVPLVDFDARPRGHGRGGDARARRMRHRLQPQQPDGHLCARRGHRAARRCRARRRARRRRRGLQRVRHGARRSGHAGAAGRPRQRRRPAHLLEDLRALRAAHRLRALCSRGQGGVRQGAPAVQREPASARSPASRR